MVQRSASESVSAGDLERVQRSATAGKIEVSKSRKELRANIIASSGTGVCSFLIQNPMNTLKIRWQVLVACGKPQFSLISFAKQELASDGVLGLWRTGLSPGLAGSVMSIGLRYGTYPLVRDSVSGLQQRWSAASLQGASPTREAKTGAAGMFVAGLASGMVGYFVASPFLMVMTQMQAESGKLGPDGRYVTGARAGQPPSYKGTVDALRTISGRGYTLDGLRGAVRSLWRGSSIITMRGGVLNAAQMMGYDGTKTELKNRGLLEEGAALHVAAAMVAALCATTLSMPLDVTLTFYQSAQNLGHTRYTTGGPLACAREMLRENGPGIFMRGWVPNFARLTPVCVCSMWIYEQLRAVVGIGYLD